MLKFDVLNRFSGEVQFTAEIDCEEGAARSVKLRLAVFWAVRTRADLLEADLSGADLGGADLSGADLSGADLRWANLRGANLLEADLSGADLLEADLSRADLSGAKGYIAGPQRSDGYRFDLRLYGGKWVVVAGCRTWQNWTTDAYRAHAATYVSEEKRAETLAILDFLDAMAKLREAA